MNRRFLGVLRSLPLLTVLLTCSCHHHHDSVITFGASFPLTGDAASYGQDARRGIELGIADANAAANGRFRIKVDFGDDRVDPKIGVSLIQRFTSVDNVPLVLGSAGSNVTMAMVPIANRSRTVLLSPISSAPQLSGAGPYFFRTCPSDAYQAVVVAHWILSKGYKSVGILYLNNSWGVGLKDAFVKEFTAGGGRVVDMEASNETDPDFRTLLEKLRATGAQALYLPTYPKQGARILLQLADLGVSLPVFGADTWGAPELIGTAGKAGEGAAFVVPEPNSGQQYKTFVAEFSRRFGRQPDFNAASSYDAARVAALAVSKVLTAGETVTGAHLAQALRGVEFQGATGLTRFDANGDVVGKAFGKRIFRSGKAVPVD